MNRQLFAPGHTACVGCGQSLGARLVIEASGPNTIVANNTGCLEVFSTKYPESSWGVPWIHSLFENAAAVASGIEAALIYLGKKDTVNVIAQGGDGGTADIGLQALSGMFERGQDILYVCYDNEAYMNTGIQRSGLTPFDANTTTSPAGSASSGNIRPKKPMPEIANAHGIPYVATASVGFPQDLQRKVKKAVSIKGPKYIQIHVPCPLGWRHEPVQTAQVAKTAVEAGLYPLVEYENTRLIAVRKIKPSPVEEYLKLQGRFKHLLNNPEEIKKIQEIANHNIEKYNLRVTSSEKNLSTEC
ncbi:MAG: pyruvate ferredoxin oxidoreductase [Candidatus Omnitrophica bacterium]|nr:pyruvate ferredoxin oxidoreductase [Candidatus Omnitrophota bacterium]MBU4345711.1 pyruvate ferredoxin oxidoreductase [Candidatus Omnitrophota bacterium]MBU4473160.1 pyruvate ferredoxin oxidoreductase [Candidatus Omnitrophota bacterium]MCG2706447.1 thiamine pyrophosphate-dependent enzyme [Candidatus Omnitrophota bacterium]